MIFFFQQSSTEYMWEQKNKTTLLSLIMDEFDFQKVILSQIAKEVEHD